jgi:hypothetical protein
VGLLGGGEESFTGHCLKWKTYLGYKLKRDKSHGGLCRAIVWQTGAMTDEYTKEEEKDLGLASDELTLCPMRFRKNYPE